ncbi:MAG TPA: cytochrome c [Gemmatimonadaceae bacterium]
MTRTGWTVAVTACIMGTLATVAPAQQTSTATTSSAATARPDSLRSTQLGVYTEAQAKRGEQTYAGICRSCHTPSEHTGAAFNQNWNAHPLLDLFAYLCQSMPKDNPGSLDPYDAADVIAFLLKLNAMPTGSAELAPDTVALKKILIDTRTTRPTP